MNASRSSLWTGILGFALSVNLGAAPMGPAVLAQEGSAARERGTASAKEEQPLFVRVDKDEEGTPRALQTAVATYEIQSGEFKGARVDLVGAVHVGERSYYQELNRRFTEYDAVLYELVANPEDRPSPRRQERGGFNPIGSLQSGMKDTLRLTFQLEEVNYQAKNFVHADMSPTEFGQDMAKRNDGLVSIFARMIGASFAAQTSKKNADLQAEMTVAMLSRDPIKMRRAMALQMEFMDNQLMGLADKDGKSTLLTERNVKAFEVLKRELNAGRRNVSIFYGAGHLLDMHQRMTRDFNAKLTKIIWLDAWDLRSDAIKK
jgi:hypothetical protein